MSKELKEGDVVVLNLNGAEQDVRVLSVHETNETIDVEGVTSKVKFHSVSAAPAKGDESIRFWRAKGKDEPEMDRVPATAPIVTDAPVVADNTPGAKAPVATK